MKLFNRKEKLMKFNYVLDKFAKYCYLRSVFMDVNDESKKDILENIIEIARLGYSEKKHGWLLNKRTLFGIWIKFSIYIDEEYNLLEWISNNNKKIPLWLNDYNEFLNYVNMYGSKSLK